MIIEWLSKKIICAAPLSIKLSGDFKFLFDLFLPLDEILQDWALNKADFFSENNWKEIQLKKLKDILIHAGRNVSYWQKLFKKMNFNPEDFCDFNNLQKILIVTRTEIKKIPITELTAKNIYRWRFKEATTSGSTGEPLKFYQDLRDNLRRKSNILSILRYVHFSNCDRVAILGLGSHYYLDNFGRRFVEWGNKDFRESVIYPYLKSKPAILIATGTDLRRFLYLIRREAAPGVAFKALIYMGDHISKLSRDYISRFFKCPVFTYYGAREFSPISVECESHKLHLAPWMGYFEIVSDNGEIVPDGCEGNVVVTFFENFAMPFIRYKIGDRAIINTELCSCGRKSKTITLYGRESEIIQFPDSDKSLSVFNLMRAIDKNYSNQIVQYQFELRGKDLMIFRYIPNTALTKTEKNNLNSLLEETLKHKFQIIKEEVTVINPSVGGKTPVFIRSQPSDS